MLEQAPAHADDVFCLRVIETDCFDIRFEPIQAQIQNGLRRISDRKEFSGGDIHPFIRRLSRQDDRDKQFKRA